MCSKFNTSLKRQVIKKKIKRHVRIKCNMSLTQDLDMEIAPADKKKLLELGLVAFLTKEGLGACVAYIRSVGVDMVDDLVYLKQVMLPLTPSRAFLLIEISFHPLISDSSLNLNVPLRATWRSWTSSKSIRTSSWMSLVVNPKVEGAISRFIVHMLRIRWWHL